MSAHILPKALTTLIDEFGNLPGVGPRTAERYAYAALRREAGQSKRLAQALSELHQRVKTCPVTFALIDESDDLSPLYTDSRRNRQLICVVEEPLDIMALERTGQFDGTYHVLGGAISPIDGIGPEQLHIPELIHPRSWLDADCFATGSRHPCGSRPGVRRPNHAVARA